MKSECRTYQLKYSKQFTTESANRLTQSCKLGEKVSNEPVIWKVGKTQFHLKGGSTRQWFMRLVPRLRDLLYCRQGEGGGPEPLIF